MRTRPALLGVAILLLATAPVSGQPPTGLRTSLVINEVMPTAAEGGLSWIEVYNAGETPVRLDRVKIKTGEGPGLTLPVPEGSSKASRELPPGRFLLVRFETGVVEPRLEVAEQPSGDPAHDLVLRLPALATSEWTRASGEIALYRIPPDGDPTGARLVDYLSWGRPGGSWNAHERRSLWPSDGFVQLSEGFGIVDPSDVLEAGSTIGLYPGRPRAEPAGWVPYEPDETSPGRPNNVPRPKAFSLADAAVVGSRSFGLGWPHRAGDEWYRVQVALDPDFSDIVLDQPTLTSVVRFVGGADLSQVYYRVKAFSKGRASLYSHWRKATLVNTSCDWPAIPDPGGFDYHLRLKSWIGHLGCAENPSCRLVDSIKFKFQRKDSPLGCCECQDAEHPRCDWQEPQPYCITVLPFGKQPAFGVCAGDLVSPDCGKPSDLASLLVENVGVQPPAPLPEQQLDTKLGHRLLVAQSACEHGEQNCVRASVSMVTSAYGGACLSQDYIAYAHYLRSKSTDAIFDRFDLGHQYSISCSDPDDIIPGDQCTENLRWALGLLPANRPVPQDTLYYDPAVPTFADIKYWVDQKRPIMSEGLVPQAGTNKKKRHMRVLAGYCIDDGDGTGSPPVEEWVFIYDPISGPRAEPYDVWAGMSIGVWVTKPATTSVPSSVQQDPPEIWQPSASSELSVFDEVHRSSSVPDCNIP